MDKGWRLQKEKNWMDTSYQVISHQLPVTRRIFIKLPSHQLPVTSHQEDIYQTDEQRYQKRREGGYLSDNID